MFKHVLVMVFVAALAVRPAAGQLPGYELIPVANSAMSEARASLNNRRQIAYLAILPSSSEIMLYDDATGETTQITNNSIQDTNPSLNHDGVLVWASVMGQTPQGDPTAAIMVRTPDGVITQLTDGDLTYDRNPVVNIHGQIAWVRWDRRGCGRAAKNIMFFDGQTIRRITDNDLTNQSLSLNDDGVMAWAEFDVCGGQGGWRSLIKLYDNGRITTLSEPGLQAQSTTINNSCLVAWQFRDPQTLEGGIHVWQDGVRTLLTDWGGGPQLNGAGDMIFHRWHEAEATWNVWAYVRGEFIQLVDDPRSNTDGAINDRRDFAWNVWNTSPLQADVLFLRRFDLGDLNCDGVIDALDIEGFLAALFDPQDYSNRYPDCDPDLADINDDGSVDALDIEPFIRLLFP